MRTTITLLLGTLTVLLATVAAQDKAHLYATPNAGAYGMNVPDYGVLNPRVTVDDWRQDPGVATGWSVHEVGDWLDNVGHGAVRAAAEQRHVTGPRLLRLSQLALEDEYGLDEATATALMGEIKQLRGPRLYEAASGAERFRFHLIGVPHTKTAKEYSACPFTQKTLKMSQMLTDLGHTVYHYGAEGSKASCTEHVDIISHEMQMEHFGGLDLSQLNLKWKACDTDTNAGCRAFEDNAVREVRARAQPDDILLISYGLDHKDVADAIGLKYTVEFSVGYSGNFAPYIVWESYAWMHATYGSRDQLLSPKYYDDVIPNSFNPDDFIFSDEKDDYYLMIARQIPLKGMRIAADAAEAAGVRLIIAGQGDLRETLNPDDYTSVEWIGAIDYHQRARLLSKARALYVPTMYVEPFGWVTVEAMLSGTPVITADWGGFTETVVHGVTGFRCRTFDDFVWATKNVGALDPHTIWEVAAGRYSPDRIGAAYDAYFTHLMDMRTEKGWYQQHPERPNLVVKSEEDGAAAAEKKEEASSGFW